MVLLKRFLKKILPPLVSEFYSLYLVNKSRKNYKSPYRYKVVLNEEELGDFENSVWENVNWIKHAKHSLREVKLTLDNFSLEKLSIHLKSLCFSYNIVRSVFSSKKINIFDVGGGVGICFPVLNNFCSLNNALYTVVDSKTNIKEGKKEFKDSKIIEFLTFEEFNDKLRIGKKKLLKEVSIVYLSSTLQYINDWKEFLLQLLKNINPHIVAIARFPVSINAKTQGFVIQDITTPQGYCGCTKAILFKPNDIDKFMISNGYEIVYNFMGEKYDYFWDGCSDEQFKEVRAKAYIFIKKMT